MKIIGPAVLTLLVLLPARWQLGMTATNPKTEKVVDASGNLRVPADYRTTYQFLGSWAVAADQVVGQRLGLVVVRCRQPFKNHIHRFQGGLSALP